MSDGSESGELVIMRVVIPMDWTFIPSPEVKRLLERGDARLIVGAADANSYTVTVRARWTA